jgi:chromate transporter
MTGLESGSVQRILEVARVFLRFGFTAFGGPTAHIAMYHDELVKRRGWLSEQHFLDLLAATNLIPGPNSTEMAIHIGWVRAGKVGMFLAGICFITPAMVMVIALAWAYSRYGNTPQFSWIMYGVQPIIIAIIIQALFDLSRIVITTLPFFIIALIACILDLLQINLLLILILCGILLLLWKNVHRLKSINSGLLLAVVSAGQIGAVAHKLNSLLQGVLASQPFTLPVMFLTFLKIGSVLYGSGYVLVAFLTADFVNRLGWLTEQQILDAIAIGQFTPGPVLTSATFIGYILGGLPGSILATIGIFLPAFVFVAISNPLVPRIRSSSTARSFLDGVIAGSLGLMAAVIIQLGQVSFPDAITFILCITAIILLVKYRVNTTLLIAAGMAVGFLVNIFT